jgi:hypothetical protein
MKAPVEAGAPAARRHLLREALGDHTPRLVSSIAGGGFVCADPAPNAAFYRPISRGGSAGAAARTPVSGARR